MVKISTSGQWALVISGFAFIVASTLFAVWELAFGRCNITTGAGFSITYWLWIATGVLGFGNIFQAFLDETLSEIDNRMRTLRWWLHAIYMSIYFLVLGRIGGQTSASSLLKIGVIPGIALAAAFSSNESLNSSDTSTGELGKTFMNTVWKIESIVVAFVIGFLTFLVLYLDNGGLTFPGSWALFLFTFAYAIFLVVNLVTVNAGVFSKEGSLQTREVVFVLAEVVLVLTIHLATFFDNGSTTCPIV